MGWASSACSEGSIATFAIHPAISNGVAPVGIAALAGDGGTEGIVVVDGSSNQIDLYTTWVGGPAGFLNRQTISTGPGSVPNSVASADLNKDGLADFAVVDGTGAEVTVFLGQSDGGFTLSATSALPDKANPSSIAIGDMNGDGYLDLVVGGTTCTLGVCSSGFGNGGAVSILLNRHDGGFGRPDLTYADEATQDGKVTTGAVALGALFGGSALDVVVGDANGMNSTANVDVFSPAGDGGGLTSPLTLDIGSLVSSTPPPALVLADFNGDGYLDAAVSDPGAGATTVILSPGGGGGGVVTLPTSEGVVTADFNFDGLPDLGMVDGSTSAEVVLSSGDGGFTGPYSFTLGVVPTLVATGDFNHDGLPDLAIADSTNKIVILLSTCAALPPCVQDSDCPDAQPGSCLTSGVSGAQFCLPPGGGSSCGGCNENWQCADGCCGDTRSCGDQSNNPGGGYCGDDLGCNGGRDNACGYPFSGC